MKNNVIQTMKAFGWLVLIVLALVISSSIFLYLSPSYNTYLVRGESMKPTLNPGDIIINGPLNSEIRAGTIVTYQQDKRLVTHRVLSMNGDTLVTQGDAAEDPDLWPVTLPDVKGIYLFKIPYISYVSSFVQTKLGWFLVLTITIVPGVSALILAVSRSLDAKRQDYR